MKIIFFGSAKFGCPALEGLIEAGYDIPLAVTQPDTRKGRGLKLGCTTVKELARRNRLKVFQPEDVNSLESLKILRSCKPDLFVIIAYGQRFSQECLSVPRIMPLNVHASLLPKYRGAAPINWAIINGDTETGNTVMKVVRKMDAGPIIRQSRVEIGPEEDSLILEEKLSSDARSLLLASVKSIEKGDFQLIEQDEKLVSVAPKLNSDIVRIKWDQPAQRIHDLVRGCLSWTAAFTGYDSRILKVYKTVLLTGSSKAGSRVPGQILEISENGIVVACGQGLLSLQELQLEGKKRLAAREFLSGNRVVVGSKLE